MRKLAVAVAAVAGLMLPFAGTAAADTVYGPYATYAKCHYAEVEMDDKGFKITKKCAKASNGKWYFNAA